LRIIAYHHVFRWRFAVISHSIVTWLSSAGQTRRTRPEGRGSLSLHQPEDADTLQVPGGIRKGMAARTLNPGTSKATTIPMAHVGSSTRTFRPEIGCVSRVVRPLHTLGARIAGKRRKWGDRPLPEMRSVSIQSDCLGPSGWRVRRRGPLLADDWQSTRLGNGAAGLLLTSFFGFMLPWPPRFGRIASNPDGGAQRKRQLHDWRICFGSSVPRRVDHPGA
jgi:hypothetical protein